MDLPWMFFLSNDRRPINVGFNSILSMLPIYQRLLIDQSNVPVEVAVKLNRACAIIYDRCNEQSFKDLEVVEAEVYETDPQSITKGGKVRKNTIAARARAVRLTVRETDAWMTSRGYQAKVLSDVRLRKRNTVVGAGTFCTDTVKALQSITR